jgi:hypothetical protein
MPIPPLIFVAFELPLIVVAAALLFLSWRRQSYRFGLSWLFLAFGLAACTIFVIAHHIAPIMTHGWAIHNIIAAGGGVTFLDEASAENASSSSRGGLQQSWRSVQRVRMADDAAATSVARHIEYLPEVRHFTLGKNVTDAGLRSFCDAAADAPIKSLVLFGSRTTSSGFVQLVKLKQTRILFIHNGAANDESLGHLKSMPSLDSLWLLEQDDSGNPDQFTTKGFSEIGTLNRLRSLQLHGLRISDVAARQLYGLARLELLMLDQCEISDAALKDLRAALPSCNVARVGSSVARVSP